MENGRAQIRDIVEIREYVLKLILVLRAYAPKDGKVKDALGNKINLKELPILAKLYLTRHFLI